MGEYSRCLAKAKNVFAAAPYVTLTEELIAAAKRGVTVRLLVGLNVATNPKALRQAFGVPNFSIRFFTDRFHAKIFLFDDAALVGSSNLTDGGMQKNREATVKLTAEEHLDEIRYLSEELWASASVLTEHTLKQFEGEVGKFNQLFDPNQKIIDVIGRVQPVNIAADSGKKTAEYMFLEALRRRVFEKFKPAFDYVTNSLSAEGLHRHEWKSEDRGSETNRFLNWVRLTYAPGDEWQTSDVPRPNAELDQVIREFGREWRVTDAPRISETYFEELQQVRKVFTSEGTLLAATREDLGHALMSIHAFYEQIRFVKGGKASLLDFFWKNNDNDELRVKKSLAYLIFGKGEFIERLYDLLYFPTWKLAYFGESCALELAGTARPELCPPMNGRSAKALRFIGFDVPTN